MLGHQELTGRIIALAIEVHRQTGPGLLEPVYAACEAFELEQAGIAPVAASRHPGFPALLPTHETQLLIYLRMNGLPVGLLMNFHAIRLKDGLTRFVAT